MSSWIPVLKEDSGNSEYLVTPFKQGFEEKYNAFARDVPIQGGIGLKQSEVPLENFLSRSRNVTNNFGVYQSQVAFNHTLTRVGDLSQVQSQRKSTEEFFQMQPESTIMHGADGRGSTTPNKKKKRMIKNRESAARSRARKQAYTSQLENEVKCLKEENNMLKENLKRIQNDITILQAAKKLRPSSSAEF